MAATTIEPTPNTGDERPAGKAKAEPAPVETPRVYWRAGAGVGVVRGAGVAAAGPSDFGGSRRGDRRRGWIAPGRAARGPANRAEGQLLDGILAQRPTGALDGLCLAHRRDTN